MCHTNTGPGMLLTLSVVVGDTHLALNFKIPMIRTLAEVQLSMNMMLGLLGLMVGLAIAAMLVAIGLAVVRSSPTTIFIALGFTYPLVAALLTGAVTLRPDHGLLIEKTRTAADSDCWGVVAHCSTRAQRQLAKTTFDRCIQAL